jgi:catechol 2,3-dioxygenase-like lactoylglutathione lyase family enzyme
MTAPRTTAGTASPARPVVTALATITIACPDPAELEELFGSVLGWHRTASGRIDAALERLWGINSGSAGAAYSLWQSGAVARGRVRLVHGSERARIRPLTPRWSGIEMIVSHDIDGLYQRLAAIPWLATMQAPVTMDWSEFGSNQHRAFILRGPGGTHLAFTMGLTRPAGREFPATQSWAGHVFELPLVTADFAAVRSFYGDLLGMQPILSSRFDRGLWHRIWKLPEPTPVSLDILKGDAPGTGLGGLELTGYPADVIDVLPAAADRFDAGTCLVTLTSERIAETYERVSGEPRARCLARPRPIDAEGYEGRQAFCFIGPAGERVEILGDG